MTSQICNKIILVSLVSFIGACSQYPAVTAKFETPQVTTHDDAADDPAIWVDVERSLKIHWFLEPTKKAAYMSIICRARKSVIQNLAILTILTSAARAV